MPDRTIPTAGRLWLGINDDAYSGNIWDNVGSLTTILALAAGLAGIGGSVIRRRR